MNNVQNVRARSRKSRAINVGSVGSFYYKAAIVKIYVVHRIRPGPFRHIGKLNIFLSFVCAVRATRSYVRAMFLTREPQNSKLAELQKR